MSSFFKGLTVTFACLATTAFGISRVGNSFGPPMLVSKELGFVALLSGDYGDASDPQDTGGHTLEAYDDVSLPGNPIRIEALSAPVDELAMQARTHLSFAFESGFQGIAWEPLSAGSDCALAFLGTQDSKVQGFVFWGNGEGVSIQGKDSSATREGIQSFIKSLRVKKGSCEWELSQSNTP
jgi:hypothetical protein